MRNEKKNQKAKQKLIFGGMIFQREVSSTTFYILGLLGIKELRYLLVRLKCNTPFVGNIELLKIDIIFSSR